MQLCELAENADHVLRSRVVWILLLTLAFCATMAHYMMNNRFVTVYDFEGEGLLHFKTTNTDLDALLAEAGVELGEHDEVKFSGGGPVMEIEIDRAYPVYVTADGTTSRVWVTDATVAQAIDLCGVELGIADQVNYSLERPLSEGEEVNITRIRYADIFYTQIIACDVEYQQTSLLRDGARRVKSDGRDGEKMVFLRDKYIDGELMSSYIQNELVTVEPENAVSLVGESGYPISPYDPFPGVETDENGRPTNAVEVRYNMRTVSYYTGVTCASGLPAQVGHIGVNPRVFPYGTKLYIESEDGSFVYGYCIAADCGPGTLNGTIDFDLFYDTYYECALMGRRNDIVVYILPD